MFVCNDSARCVQCARQLDTVHETDWNVEVERGLAERWEIFFGGGMDGLEGWNTDL